MPRSGRPGQLCGSRPPEEVQAGVLLLRRARPTDAHVVAAVVGASLAHLRPWMPWATAEAADYRAQLTRLEEADELWDMGTDYVYAVFAPDGTMVGNIGLHRRVGDGGMEIGYWIAAGKTCRGYATAAARAMTAVALGLPGVTRVEIHCDVANTASAAIPRKLGYRLDRTDAHEPEAPGERGRRLVWVWEPGSAGAGD